MSPVSEAAVSPQAVAALARRRYAYGLGRAFAMGGVHGAKRCFQDQGGARTDLWSALMEWPA